MCINYDDYYKHQHRRGRWVGGYGSDRIDSHVL